MLTKEQLLYTSSRQALSSISVLPKVVIPGGAGYLGSILTEYFVAQGKEVVILTRKPRPSEGNVHFIEWDGETFGDWVYHLSGAGAVINLAGRTVNCRYTPKNRQEIYDSRLNSTRILGIAIECLNNPPPLWINSSSATIYRHAEDRPMDEKTGELGDGFSPDVCKKWEQTLFEAKTPQTRRVALRSTMVFGRGKGGVCEAFYRVVKRGLGGTMGNGKQYVSWIHSDDFCRAIAWIMDHEALDGTINCASPNPISNEFFMSLFREACGMKVGLPATRWMLEFGAFFLKTETELLLKSRWVVPTLLKESGFTLKYPHFKGALDAILSDPRGTGF